MIVRELMIGDAVQRNGHLFGITDISSYRAQVTATMCYVFIVIHLCISKYSLLKELLPTNDISP